MARRVMSSRAESSSLRNRGMTCSPHPDQHSQGDSRRRRQDSLLQGEHTGTAAGTIVIADGGLHGVGHAEKEGADDAVHIHHDGKGAYRRGAGQMEQYTVEDDHEHRAGDAGEEF